MEQRILVTGATGTVGSEVVRALQSRGASSVAGVRDENKAKKLLGEGVSTVHFDFEEPDTFASATQSVDRVFLLGPPMELRLDELVDPFIDFLHRQKIRRVTYLSAFRADAMEGLPFHTNVERKLKDLSFDWTILQPSFFSQNFQNYEYENITERGITYMPAGDGKVGFVDVRDVGEVAAEVFASDQHTHQTYVLTGPALLSYHDAAEQLTEVIGKPIQYPMPSPEEFADTLKKSGAPEFVATYMNEVYGLIRDGKVDHISDAVDEVLQRPPTPLREVLQRTFGPGA